LVKRVFAGQSAVIGVLIKVFAFMRLSAVVSLVIEIWFYDSDRRAHTCYRW